MNLTSDESFLMEEENATAERHPFGGKRSFWRQFRRQPFAIAALVVLGLIVLLVVCAPLILHGYDPYGSTVAPQATAFGLDPNIAPSFADFPLRLFGRTNLEAGPPTTAIINDRQSVFAEVLLGGQSTLLIGLGAALISGFIGTLLGSVSGYYGGVIDALLMRLADFFLAIPFLPLVVALIVTSQLGKISVVSLILIFSLAGWPPMARLVRATILTLREQEFTEAARAAGVGNLRIILRHLLPNAINAIIVTATLSVATFILAEATLEYFNLIQLGGNPTWGAIIADSEQFLLANYWWWTFFPGLFLTLTVLCINLLGEGLRDALDVRNRAW